MLEEIPEIGMEFDYHNFNFIVENVEDYRIKQIKVKKKELVT